MTSTQFEAAHRQPARRIARLLAATGTAAFLAVATLAATGSLHQVIAQTVAEVDTSKLPRPSAMKQLVALPQTTIILSSEPVTDAARSAMKLLEAAGWQPYSAPFSQEAQQPTSRMVSLKKGRQAITLFVQPAPAHNNATSISYTAVPLERDLPFPVGATGIQFSPERLHLDATAPQPHGALLAFYRTELTAAGWALHSASDGSAAMKVPTGEGMQHAFFTHPQHGALHVTSKKQDEAKSVVSVRSVPASVLPGAQAARPPAPPVPTASQPNPQAEAHAKMSQSFDTMAQDLMKQALQPPPKGGLDNALEMARKAGVAIDMPGAGVPPKSASAEPAPQAAAEAALERDETAGLPVPKASSSKGHERSPWRIEAQATVKATPASVLAFYRKELVALGWKETAPARTEGAKTIVGYAAADGPGVLTLTRKGQETSISLLLRKEAEAKKSGMMPKAGQAKILIGNMHDTAATVIVGGKTFKVAPGVGSEKPDGPSLDVPPGNHKVTIKIAGSPDSTEVVTVQGNDIWGVLIGPGGALPVQMY